jgi:membrane protease YdiL (CAAX protease family)
MQTYLKTRPAGSQLLLFIGVSILFFVILSFIAVPVLSAITGISLFDIAKQDTWRNNVEGVSTFMRGMIVAQFLGLFVLPSFLYASMADPKPGQYLGLKTPHHHNFWPIAVLLLLVSIPLVELLGFLNQKIQFTGAIYNWMKAREEEAASQVQFLAARHTVKELFLNLFFIAVLAGIGEEIFFRGVLQRLLIRITKSPWAGIIITAFLFSAFHLQFFGFFPRFFLGILLGALYWYSGSLWVAILAHFFYDALLVTIIYANPELARDPNATMIKTSMIAIPAIISALLVYMLLTQMKRLSKTSYEDVYKDDYTSNDQFSF